MTADRDLIAAARAVDVGATAAPWFDCENDLIGGRCVRTVDAPASELPGGFVVDEVLRDADAGHIVWMRNNLGEIVRRWESDGRDLRAHAAVLDVIMAELGITDGDDEAIVACIRQLRAQREQAEQARDDTRAAIDIVQAAHDLQLERLAAELSKAQRKIARLERRG